MGLDMYLEKEFYIGANYEHNQITGVIEIRERGERIPINFRRVSTISEQVIYWRKANQIHRWFVENVQEGNDDCGNYYVSAEQLIELRSLCHRVLSNHDLAEKLLPSRSGFFFGGIDYDEYYFEDLEYTVRAISALLREWRGCFDYVYHSSW